MENRKYQWYEKRAGYGDSVDVIGWYECKDGVLKGMMCKAGVGCYDTEEEAELAWGEMNWNSPYLEPSQSLNHLPGEEDYVPGGAYPDDWNDGW
jgi:hypothetical protein